MNLKKVLLIIMIITYVTGFSILFEILQKSHSKYFEYRIGEFTLNWYLVMLIPLIYHVGFGIISSFIITPVIRLESKMVSILFGIIVVYMSFFPILIYIPSTILRNLLPPSKFYNLIQIGNITVLFRVLFGLIIGGLIQQKNLKKVTD